MKNSRTGPALGPSKLIASPQSFLYLAAEIILGELREVVAVGAEVVVHHVENHAEAGGVRSIDEAAKSSGRP